jgi:SRSO17 transposase
MHQSLHHIVAAAPWSDEALLKQVRRQVLPAMTKKHALAAWIVDDTGFPKKGSHSVGVTRQYCGQLGKQENCRVAVSVSLATEQASMPATYQLYLPEIWANDLERRKQAGVPKEIRFQTKPEITLGHIRSLVNEDVPRGVVLADAAYGNDGGFREGLISLGLSYAVGIQSSTALWPPGIVPLPPQPKGKMGRPPRLLRRDEQHQPLTAKELSLCLSAADLRRVSILRQSRRPYGCGPLKGAFSQPVKSKSKNKSKSSSRLCAIGCEANGVVKADSLKCQTSAATPAEPKDLLFWLATYATDC